MTDPTGTPAEPRATEPATTRGAWQLFRIRGIPVRADASCLLLLGLGGWWYYEILRGLEPLGSVVVFGSVAACALLLFASILAHEIGHAVASLAVGVRVASISLFALGGATHTEETKSAGKELLVVGGGPIVSFALFFGFNVLAAFTESPVLFAVFRVMGGTNLILGIFNVVPAYPLDGGRLLRSVLWAVTGQPHLATRLAARVGQGLAGLLILGAVLGYLGVVEADVARSNPILSFLLAGDLFRILIGFFLFRGATDAYRRAQLFERIERRSLRDVMGSVPPRLLADFSLDEALEIVQQRPSLLWPVGDPVVGGLLLGDIDDIPNHLWPTTTVGEVATPVEQSAVDVATTLEAAVQRLADAPGNMLIVTDHGRPVGLLTPSLVADLAG